LESAKAGKNATVSYSSTNCRKLIIAFLISIQINIFSIIQATHNAKKYETLLDESLKGKPEAEILKDAQEIIEEGKRRNGN